MQNLSSAQDRAERVLVEQDDRVKSVWKILQQKPLGFYIQALQSLSEEEVRGLEALEPQDLGEGFDEKCRAWHADPQQAWNLLVADSDDETETIVRDWQKAVLVSLNEFCNGSDLLDVLARLKRLEQNLKSFKQRKEEILKQFESSKDLETQVEQLVLLSPKSPKMPPPTEGLFQSPTRPMVPPPSPYKKDDL
jgi:hypothetical protein